MGVEVSGAVEKLSPREVSLMRHACGMNSKTPGYRNYFAASLDSDDDRAWAGLVTKGMARVTREPVLWWPLRVYSVTSAGRRVLERERAVTAALDEYFAALDARREET